MGLVVEVVRLLEYLMLVYLAAGEFHQRLGAEEVLWGRIRAMVVIRSWYFRQAMGEGRHFFLQDLGLAE